MNTDRTGEHLGNYRLLKLLGQGGFAEVYLGEHIYLGTQAAIKVLHTQVASENPEDFLTEARTVARLEHPNIVRVLEFGIEAGMPFLVMNVAPNGSLRQRHPNGVPLLLPTIVSYVRQLADALQYAHEKKVIHRDVKPENMLVGRRNEILLSDFGIALVAQSTNSQSRQEILGTVPYMAPEQLRGKPRPASDQYALGIVVYEWVCGSRPFYGSFTEIAMQQMFGYPPPLSERNPTILPRVEQVIMRALAKEPHQRFAHVQAFATALEQACLSLQPLPNVFPRQPLEPTIAIIPSTQQGWSTIPTVPLSQTPEPESVNTAFVQKKPSISRRAVLIGLGGLLVVGGVTPWIVTRHLSPLPIFSRSTATLSSTHTSSPTPPALGTLLFTYRGHSAGVTALAWSPNGNHLASGGFDQTAQVWDAVRGSHSYTYHGHTNVVYNVTWSSESKQVASASRDQTVQVWDALTGNRTYIYTSSSVMDSAAWSPDGTRIASASDDGTAQVWDATTGAHLLLYRNHMPDSHVHMVAWSPDNVRVASGGDDTTVQIWERLSGNPLYTYRGHTKTVWDVGWSPDGTRIASASDDGTVQVWDATTGNPITTYRGHAGPVHTAAWSPESTHIASGGDDATVHVWDASSGSHVYTYYGHTLRVWRVAWSPKERTLASGSDDMTVHVWQAV